MFLIPLTCSKICWIASFLFCSFLVPDEIFDSPAHLLQLLLVFFRDGPSFLDESFDFVVSAFCLFSLVVLRQLFVSNIFGFSCVASDFAPSLRMLAASLFVHPSACIFFSASISFCAATAAPACASDAAAFPSTHPSACVFASAASFPYCFCAAAAASASC